MTTATPENMTNLTNHRNKDDSAPTSDEVLCFPSFLYRDWKDAPRSLIGGGACRRSTRQVTRIISPRQHHARSTTTTNSPYGDDETQIVRSKRSFWMLSQEEPQESAAVSGTLQEAGVQSSFLSFSEEVRDETTSSEESATIDQQPTELDSDAIVLSSPPKKLSKSKPHKVVWDSRRLDPDTTKQLHTCAARQRRTIPMSQASQPSASLLAN